MALNSRSISLLALLSVSFTSTSAFALLPMSSINTELNANKPSGSFFNQVPSEDDREKEKEKKIVEEKPSILDNLLINSNNMETEEEEEKPTDSKAEDTADPFEQSLEKLLSTRKAKSKASRPSTIDGVPTSKASGFGKASSQPKIINTRTSITSKTTVKKSFVGIGKPMNDINKPEYDDQGYTLYADETTGEKSRVFEALVDYPSVFKMKIIGANESTFSSDMRQIVADSCNVSFEEVKYTERLKGKWLSVTVHAPVENAEMLYSLYENVDKDPRVKFKF